MRAAALSLIRTLGRYAVLVFVVAGVLLFIGWLSLIDTHPIYAVFAVPIVLPIVLVSNLLLLGVIWAGLRRRPGCYASRTEAGELWRIWDEFSSPKWGERRLLCIDDAFNASIAERQRFLGLAFPEVTMTIGLPMLHALDVPTVRAVVAHEVGHHVCRHTGGLANVAEFERALSEVFGHFPQETSITGWALFAAVGSLGDWLKVEELRLSRQVELEADAKAAQAIGQDALAASLVAFAANAGRYETDIVKPLHDDLVKQSSVPLAPMEQLLMERERPAKLVLERHARVAFERPPNPASTHPALSESLAAAGCPVLPGVPELGPSALVLVSKRLGDSVRADHCRSWERYATMYLRLE
jgi:hypothetical protein